MYIEQTNETNSKKCVPINLHLFFEEGHKYEAFLKHGAWRCDGEDGNETNLTFYITGLRLGVTFTG